MLCGCLFDRVRRVVPHQGLYVQLGARYLSRSVPRNMVRMQNENIVQKIWSLCHILRGDGISYHQYVSELTYLLFLKIAAETDIEHLLPESYRWSDLVNRQTEGMLGFYQEMLTHLGSSADSQIIRMIYAFPTTVFSHSENLRAVVDGIAKIEWQDVAGDHFGEIYEGLIEKSSQDVRSGAGQYFTPRALISAVVSVLKPRLGEQIQDPAVGSGGFLIAADRFVRSQHSQQDYAANPPRYQGAEIEKNTRRICLMNTFLNGLDAEIIQGDSLTSDADGLKPADLILANPPFGNKAGSKRAIRKEIPFQTANKQLAFLQQIYLGLKDGGRAGVVLPDNVLFEDGVGRQVRQSLMQNCNLHTIIRLPNGTFQSAGVKTNVLFFSKEAGTSTRGVWVYDLRTGMPTFRRGDQLTSKHFEGFQECYGDDPGGKSTRKDLGPSGRFRYFSRDEIQARDDDLDILWLSGEAEGEDELASPEELAAAILDHLRTALSEIEGLAGELGEGGD